MEDICYLLVRLATDKRLSDRLPNPCLITLSPPRMDRIYGSTCHQHVVPISGDPEIFLSLDMRKFTFLFKAFSWWTWDSNSRPTAQGLPTTPFVKALVRWATCKRLTDRLPKLSLKTLSTRPVNNDKFVPTMQSPLWMTLLTPKRRFTNQIWKGIPGNLYSRLTNQI